MRSVTVVSVTVVIAEVVGKHAPQVRSIEDDPVVQALPPDRSDQAFYVRVLPSRARCDHLFFQANTGYPLHKPSAVDASPTP
jgi:hypothetical protein